MFARIIFAALLLIACLIYQAPDVMSAGPSKIGASQNGQTDVSTEPIISPQEKKCLEARQQICQRDYRQCKQEQSGGFGLGFSACYQIKVSCLEDCKMDYEDCKDDCSEHYVSGCRKKCRKARNNCDDTCEKEGNDCTANAASSKPVTRPESDCELRRKQCMEVTKDSCKREGVNPGTKY